MKNKILLLLRYYSDLFKGISKNSLTIKIDVKNINLDALHYLNIKKTPSPRCLFYKLLNKIIKSSFKYEQQ